MNLSLGRRRFIFGLAQEGQPVHRRDPPGRPPSPPAGPRPAREHATGGWPAASARTKPRSRSATPADGLLQAPVQPWPALPGPRRWQLRQARPDQAQDQAPPRRARRPWLRRHHHSQAQPRRPGHRTDPSRLTRPAQRRRTITVGRRRLPRLRFISGQPLT